ncbi:jg4815 [Pararge aegeria aegeria]|uniref:Jg4815 protein n=1 Tax=Pararge aegeria aegeria TaxID=348720 RepID=A0A8S4S970_9NEOP|nr:jg4815 [Pararge aegeria aegeria]
MKRASVSKHYSAICVDVTGGTDRPFTITFKPYVAGDAPIRIDNLCDDLFLKLHQSDSGQVALLSPYQSMLYTWDDPVKERKILWNLYNNKGKGFLADFSQDGFGEEKVSFHSVKHSTLIATNSVTSKLSSTLKRLTPKSPEPSTSSSDDSDSCDLPEAHTKSKKMRKDKVIVYWISFMDGYQRVFALAQDERIAYQYKMRINSERSNYEVYMSLASVGLSICVQTGNGVKELSYISMTDSLPKWEVNVGNKWKQLATDVTSWIEEKYQTEQKKCQLKEYLHIDLEKMQMTKPFFSELRRSYNPAVWLQFRKSDTFTYCHLKLQRLQIDNQLHEAAFPSVLYPAPLPPHLKSRDVRPCIEIVTLKQFRPNLNQDVYKYFKILIQEYCVNLDRGFVNHVFDILNHWKIEEKPAVRLRADLALVHMPLPVVAMRSQTCAQRDVVFEFVHLSPIKLVLSLSSRGYSNENVDSPTKIRYGNLKENRPKLFNSDLLEYLFNSWGSSLCDMKDVVIRMSYLELRNAPITMSSLLDVASRHYRLQLVQQFYVLVLGLNILGNPYSYIGDFSKELKDYYEPCLATACSRRVSDAALALFNGAAKLLGCTSDYTVPNVFEDAPKLRPPKRRSGNDPETSQLAIVDEITKLGFVVSSNQCNDVMPIQSCKVPFSIHWLEWIAFLGVIPTLRFTSLLFYDFQGDEGKIVDDLPEAVIEANRNNPTSVALAVTGLIARPTFDICREAARAALSRQVGVDGAEAALRACVQRSGGRLVARRRLPRHCSAVEGLRPYSAAAARGAALLSQLARGHYADTDSYVAHAHLGRSSLSTLLVSTQHIFLVRAGGAKGWRIEWVVKLDDLLGAPVAKDGKLVLSVKQDEMVNYFSTDEKVIEIAEPEVLKWLQAKMECALIHAMEDKRCAGDQ